MRRSERLLRAAAVACLSTGVALAMHVAGGGILPAAPGIVVPLVLAFAVSIQLAAAAMSRWRLGSAVVVSQALFHSLFALGSGPSVVATGTGAHGSHQPTALTLDSAGAGATHGHFTPSMLAAHAGAAIATYALLRRADVLVSLIRRAAHALTTRLTLTPRRLAARPRIVVRSGRIPVALRIARSPHGLRGPPLHLA
ncbi:hypothetical protein [Demequina sp.]|uniref:hypothetical protein n=1 Tax=Demequina sp. TaxID=2050685 RepID=UPI0025C3FDB8|nr:hypothetical protein [Demequina sp.]